MPTGHGRNEAKLLFANDYLTSLTIHAGLLIQIGLNSHLCVLSYIQPEQIEITDVIIIHPDEWNRIRYP